MNLKTDKTCVEILSIDAKQKEMFEHRKHTNAQKALKKAKNISTEVALTITGWWIG